MSDYVRSLRAEAERKRQEFGPAQALEDLENWGLAFCRAHLDDQYAVSLMDEKMALASFSSRYWKTRRNLRLAYRMYRAEIERRREVVEEVARAWGIE